MIRIDHIVDRFYVLGPFAHKSIAWHGDVHGAVRSLTYYSIPVRESRARQAKRKNRGPL